MLAGTSGGVLFSALAHHVQRRVAAWRRSAEGVAKLAVQTPVVRMEVADVPLFSGLDVTELDPGHVHPMYTIFSGGTSSIRASAFSPDGRWLATGSEDNSARLWDSETGKLHGGALEHDSPVVGLAFVHGEPTFASLTDSGWLRFWRAEEAAPLAPATRLSDAAFALALSPAGPRFAVALLDRLEVYADRRSCARSTSAGRWRASRSRRTESGS